MNLAIDDKYGLLFKLYFEGAFNWAYVCVSTDFYVNVLCIFETRACIFRHLYLIYNSRHHYPFFVTYISIIS